LDTKLKKIKRDLATKMVQLNAELITKKRQIEKLVKEKRELEKKI